MSAASDTHLDRQASSVALPDEVRERIGASLFTVKSHFGGGTGFVVHQGQYEEGHPFTVVATAHHVVEDAMTARAEIDFAHGLSGRCYVANPRHYGIRRAGHLDIALCMIADFEFPTAKVPLKAPNDMYLPAGDWAYWMGYPDLVENYAKVPVPCVFAGICGAHFDAPLDKPDGSPAINAAGERLSETLYVLDGSVLPGCSGGPTFTRDGQVFGVVVAHGAQYDKSGALRTAGVTLAIPLWQAVREALKQPASSSDQAGT